MEVISIILRCSLICHTWIKRFDVSMRIGGVEKFESPELLRRICARQQYSCLVFLNFGHQKKKGPAKCTPKMASSTTRRFKGWNYSNHGFYFPPSPSLISSLHLVPSLLAARARLCPHPPYLTASSSKPALLGSRPCSTSFLAAVCLASQGPRGCNDKYATGYAL